MSMCILAIVVILILLFIVFYCRSGGSEGFGRGGPVLDFLPTVGEFPTGEGGYVDEADIPY